MGLVKSCSLLSCILIHHIFKTGGETPPVGEDFSANKGKVTLGLLGLVLHWP